MGDTNTNICVARPCNYLYINVLYMGCSDSQMFGHCVWYTIHRDHKICCLIGILSTKFGTSLFQGHITISKCMSAKTANNEYAKHCFEVKPWFKIVGNPYQTKVRDFHSIQIDCEMYGVKSLGNFHISIAYKNTTFTSEEIEMATNMIPADYIRSNDIYVSLNDCRTRLPIHWKQLKRCII